MLVAQLSMDLLWKADMKLYKGGTVALQAYLVAVVSQLETNKSSEWGPEV